MWGSGRKWRSFRGRTRQLVFQVLFKGTAPNTRNSPCPADRSEAGVSAADLGQGENDMAQLGCSRGTAVERLYSLRRLTD